MAKRLLTAKNEDEEMELAVLVMETIKERADGLANDYLPFASDLMDAISAEDEFAGPVVGGLIGLARSYCFKRNEQDPVLGGEGLPEDGPGLYWLSELPALAGPYDAATGDDSGSYLKEPLYHGVSVMDLAFLAKLAYDWQRPEQAAAFRYDIRVEDRREGLAMFVLHGIITPGEAEALVEGPVLEESDDGYALHSVRTDPKKWPEPLDWTILRSIWGDDSEEDEDYEEDED